MAASKILKILLASGTVLLALWLLLAMFTAMNLSGDTDQNLDPARLMEGQPEEIEKPEVIVSSSPWRTIDLTTKTIPDEARAAARNISIEPYETIVEGATVIVLESDPIGKPQPFQLLFLHGAQFDSEIWKKLGTLQLMSALNYSCVAIDLPGYGKSTGSLAANRVIFMTKLFERLKLDKNVVMVSPSMSGGFSLPFVLTKPELFAGFVPIAPVGTSIVPRTKLGQLEVPTLYLYGERDKDLGIKARDDLNAIPNLRIISIPNAGHAAYLDQPEIFHSLLYNYLQNLE